MENGRLQSLYSHWKRDAKGAYIIEVYVERIHDFYCPYDPSPLHRKDINPRIMEIIMSQMVVLPKDARVELHIHLPKQLRKKRYENLLERAIKYQFQYELNDNQLHMQRRLHKGLVTLLLAVCLFVILFTGSYLLDKWSGDSIMLRLLASGMSIGAWVSLWHPMELLLYKWLPLYEDKRKYERLTKMAVRFKYV